MKINFMLKIIIFLIAVSSYGQKKRNNKGTDLWAGKHQLLLLNFEDNALYNSVETLGEAKSSVTTKHGVTLGKKALEINVSEREEKSGVVIKLIKPVSTKQFKNYSLVFDVTNTTKEYSTQIFVTLKGGGTEVRKSAAIASGATETCFFELAGRYIKKNIGFKDDPSPWKTEAIHMKYLGGKQPFEISKIEEIHFTILHPVVNKTIVIDNVRLVENPVIPEDYLIHIIDKYGQPAKEDYDYKIHSDEALKKLAKNELNALAKEGKMKGRSKFGGWLDGPKQNGTGYFRVAKIDGKYTLVDPEGYLFFSTGIANVRMSNTTTFTGRDFKNDEVRKDEVNGVTPEDSKGMIALDESITGTSFVAHPERYHMFMDLPTYDSPLANHYSYRKEHYLSPFKQGETFSHYQANLERKYGEETPGAYLSKWEEVTLNRFLNWGFTSFGNWTGIEFYHKNRMPYFANGWIIGDFKTVPSGYWGGVVPDVFDIEFEKRADITVKNIADEVKNNPWCIGVFIDNEKTWGLPGSLKGQYGIVLEALKLEAEKSPTKQQFTGELKKKYKTIVALNEAWDTAIESWTAFDTGIDLKKQEDFNKTVEKDFSELLEFFASRYFEITEKALEKYMPNHLYMGCRFAAWGMNQEVVRAAKKHVDVISYNYYEETIGSKHWDFLDSIDMPSIIGEFHSGVVGPDTFNAGLVMASSLKDRARMYAKYMETVINNKYFVGAHWFQYIDSPVSGRAYDGENYNVGFVRNTDVPYVDMVNAAKKINKNLYQRRFLNK